jgi:amino acid adenylation domain-containing protein
MDGMHTQPVSPRATAAGTCERIALATDFRSSRNRLATAKQLETSVDGATRSALLNAAARLDTSPADAILAAFAVLLHRLGNSTELTIGIVRDQLDSGAHERPLLPATGAAQLSFDDDANFVNLLAQLRTPVRPQGELPGHSCNVVFGETSNRDADAALAASDEASREVALLLEDLGSTLSLRVVYDAQLFRPERMRELLAQLELLLPRLLAEPERSLFDHSLVTAAARTLLPDPTRPIDAPPYLPLADAFAAWAVRAPDQPAIRQAGRTISYGELSNRVERLARFIRCRAASGEVVAVTGPRSFALVTSLLGVFQSGAVLLTLDPTLPLERRRVMLEQSGAKLILAADAAADCDALASPERPLVRVSEAGLSSDLAAVSCTTGLPAIEPDQPAYVFFTSGSTGVPKAVLGRHKGLAHFLAWQREEFGILPSDRASQLTALSFDVVLRDMFLALTSGACLCLPECADVTDPVQILGWLAQERVSVLHVVPSLARLWLSHVPDELEFPHLRRVFFAGEPLTDVLVARCREVFGAQVEIVNLYGPTETTLAKCFHRIPEEPDPGIQSIGKPMSHTQVLILNRKRQLCGIAEAGEIAIRTPFRSLGYLNAPEATARAFVPNPFGSDTDDLIYLTGDGGRYRADGNLEILGRIDGQVKIRGVRIEPGEIESALGHHPNVREAVVVARQDASDTKFLAAYIVPKTPSWVSDPTASIAELRAFLRQRLPEVMVPSAFGLLAALPLNANGKVDKKALPVLERSAGTPASAAPQNAREQELASIWREVLGLREVGVHDSFYDLGGDSLTAVRVILRMRVLGIEESVCRAILHGQTIAQIARAAGSGAETSPDHSQPLSSDARLRLSFNVFRGLMIGLIILYHFTPGIARRSAFVAAHEKHLQPLYNWATPGFAFAFGITLGFIYHPQWLAHPERTRALISRATWIVGAGAAIIAVTAWAMSPFTPLQPHESPFANVLSFYALGLASTVVWFRLLGSSKTTRNALLFAVACGVVHYGLKRFAGVIPAHSPVLVFVGKWGYFNMWVGSLLGFVFGQRLKRYGIVPSRDALLGALLIAAGFTLSLLQGVGAFFVDQKQIEPWKWLFYGGLSVCLMVAVERVIRVLPSPGVGRVALNVFGVFGQLTLPLYLLHYLAWSLSMACTALGFSFVARLCVEMGVLISIGYLMTRRLYRLYYGAEPTVQTLPVVKRADLPAS